MKFTKILLVSLIFMLYTINGVQAAQPYTDGKSAILMDAGSGRVLWEKNSHQRLPMASTTKIMTAIVAIEKGNLNDIVAVTPSTTGIEGSSIWLSPGEKHTLENLLFGLMLRSGNDAAMTIAMHVGGSVEKFVDMMNKKAKEIGATDTHFMNPHGLHHDNHYTTAYDLALITSYALKNKEFVRIVSTKYKKIPWEGHQWDRAMKNKNKLLWQYEGANGVKTGYTRKAGRCLVASAIRDGLQLVSVVLNCGPMFEDCMKIMDYGFKNYKKYVIYNPGETLAMVSVDNGWEKEVYLVTKEKFAVALREEERPLLKVNIDKPSCIMAPVVKDKEYGKARVYLEDELFREIPLIASESVEEKTFSSSLKKIFEKWMYPQN